MRRHPGCVVPAVLLVVLLPLASPPSAHHRRSRRHWRVTFLAVPTCPFSTTALHTYKGDVTFSAVWRRLGDAHAR